MGNRLVSAYERVDTFEEGVRRTKYRMGNFNYDSLSELAEHIVGHLGKEGSFEEVSLYRSNLQVFTEEKRRELENLCTGISAIHVTREDSRVINAFGDEDDLLKLHRIIADLMQSVGVNR